MPSTYTLNNGITLIATGEQSGTWGATTNVNLELVDTALDGQVTVTLASAGSSGSPNALPISDGAASNGRNRMVIFDDGGDLGATAYVQLTPNDSEKIIYVRNALSGSRSILLFQGTYNASNDYEVPAGTTAVVYFNGGGTGAVAANVFNNAYFDGLRLGSVSVTAILDEDDMSSDSATALATQQSIKAYVDSQVGTVDTLAEILANGNTTGGTDIVVSSGDVITTNTINETTAASGVTIDSLLVKDGGITAAGTSTFAGQTITNLGAVTTADINGGTIDGTVIGGSSAAAATVTTLTASGLASVGDLTLTAGNPEILTGDNSTFLYISGSTTKDLGGNIILVPDSHPSVPNDIIFRSDTTNVMRWDNSASTFDLLGNALSAGDGTFDALKVTTTFGTITGASTGYIDNASGNMRVVSLGPNTSTNGTITFSSRRSDASNATDLLSIGGSTGNATFTGDVNIFGAGGGFSTSSSGLYIDSADQGEIVVDNAGGANAYSRINFAEAGTKKWRVEYDGVSNHLEFTENGVAAHLTIADTTGNATFAGTAVINSGASGASAAGDGDDLVVEMSGAGGMSLLGVDASNIDLRFGTPSDVIGMLARWNYNASTGYFGTSKSGASTVIWGDNQTPNLTLSGAAGSETATFAGNAAIGGATLKSWGAGFDAFQLENGGLFTAAGGTGLYVNENSYFDGTNYKYSTTAGASQVYQSGGTIRLNVAASGTAGTNVTFTNALEIGSTGNASFAGTLDVAGETDFSERVTIDHNDKGWTRNGNADDLVVMNSGAVGINILGDAATGQGRLLFGTEVDSSRGGLLYEMATDTFSLSTADVTALTLDSSQNATFAGEYVLIEQGAGTLPSSTNNGLIVQHNANIADNAVISLISGTSGDSRVEFGDANDRDVGIIRYTHSDNTMRFGVNATADVLTVGPTIVDITAQLQLEDSQYPEILITANQASARTSYLSGVSYGFIGMTGTTGGSYPFDAAGNLILQSRANVDRDIVFVTGATPSEKLTIDGATGAATFAGDVVFSTSSAGLRTDTSDGSDNKYLTLSGGGGSAISRGALIELYGNENGSLGALTLAAGQVSGSKINFYAGTSGSIGMAFDADGLKFNGDTAAANALDDYEEGTFTPVFADAITGGNTAAGGTFDGSYTKVGRLVYVTIRCQDIDTTGMTGGNIFYIRNLPFVAGTAGANYRSAAPVLDAVSFSGYVVASVFGSTSALDLRKIVSGVGDTSLTVSDVTSGSGDIYLSIIYEAAA